MAIERSLRSKLEEVLGEEHGAELMKRLPEEQPATKADIERLEERFDDRFARSDERFKELEQRFDLKLEALEHRLMGRLGTMQYELATALGSQTRSFIIAMAGMMISLGAALLVATR